MSDQVQMACTKCGRNEGYLQALRDFDYCEARAIRWFVPVVAGCSGCDHKVVKHVNVQACWNLLRSVALSDVLAAERCLCWYGLSPGAWKLWSSLDTISMDELGFRYRNVRDALDAFLPGDDAIRSRLSSWDYDPVIINGDSLWRFSRFEWVSLFRAINSVRRETVHSPDVFIPLLNAMVGR